MLGRRKGAREFDQMVTLTYSDITADDYGRAEIECSPSALEHRSECHASVVRMSANRTMLTFQLADVIGVDIRMRRPDRMPNGIIWNGHEIHFGDPEDVDGRGKYILIRGYYQQEAYNG